MAFAETGVIVEFKGKDIDELGDVVGIDEAVFEQKVGAVYLDDFRKRIGTSVVGVDPAYFRPSEVDILVGDSTKARQKLGWQPKYNLQQLCEDMIVSDLNLMKKEDYLKEGGYRILNYFE
jgi:GDPmannose 4,6-dehydratase